MRRRIRFPAAGRPRSAALATVALLAACGRGDAPKPETADSATAPAAAATTDGTAGTPAAATVTFTAAQVQHGGVQWAPVTTTDAPSTLELPGQLVPDEDRTAQLGAPASGRVVAVHVRIGDRVSAGQPLVTLQSAEANAARADYDKAVAGLSAARASAAFARAERERAARLFAIKAASREEVERSETDDEVAQGAVKQGEAELARARAARAQLGATASGTMVLRAPVGGVVLSRDAVPGTVAEPGAPLVAVTDPRTLWLEIAASDRAAGGIRQGATVRFVVPAFPGDTFRARVQSVGSGLDTASRTVPVRAVVQNPGRLRPAMFATTWIEGGERRQVVTLPTDAVQLLDNRPVVFVARPDGKGGATFVRRDVETSAPSGGRIQVVGGLAPGDVVVMAGAFAVKAEFSRAKMAKE